MLLPGFVDRIVRVGDTVRRPAERWTPTTAALLSHYETVGLGLTPRHLGYDDQGREMLTWLTGDTVNERTLDPVALGRAVRQLHDAGETFRPGDDAPWQWAVGPARDGQVYCHNDLGPWNVLGSDTAVTGFIDFDTAAPADPLWELADLAYRFGPLYSSTFLARFDWHPTLAARADRIVAIADGYGLPARRRRALAERLVPNLQRHVDRLTARARAATGASARVAADGARVDAEALRWLSCHADDLLPLIG